MKHYSIFSINVNMYPQSGNKLNNYLILGSKLILGYNGVILSGAKHQTIMMQLTV